MDKLVGVKGMNDLLPEQMRQWERLEVAVAETFRLYGYAAIRTPILEPTALFVRGIGDQRPPLGFERAELEESLHVREPAATEQQGGDLEEA